MTYAEVIGDPIAQSKSPIIHKAWLAELGLGGDYRAIRVMPDALAGYFAARRADPDWRGCNVTIPHKEKVLAHLDHVESGAAEIGAVNCIYPGPLGLTGRNTDIDGVAAALDGTPVEGQKIALIGAGGGARAAIRYLADRHAETIALIVRDPKKAASFRREGPDTRIEIWPIEDCEAALNGAAAIVNASPMGMDGAAAMPPALLAAITAQAQGRTLFDMVYKPLVTPFLAAAHDHGGTAIDGLTMLIGQARAAFALFYGHDATADDEALRDRLAT